MIKRNSQSGAVSIFVVIFAMLTMTVMAVSFVTIMINDQRQSTENELSQSAYDSALAGVEDAKRALLQCEASAACDPVPAWETTCNTAITNANVAVPNASGEVMIERTSGNAIDDVLSQAYTCVRITMNTDDYLGTLTADQSKLVPLRGVSAFNRVTLQWFSREDVTNTTGAVSLTTMGTQALLQAANWPSNRPSILRSQLMQTGGTFTLSDFDVTRDSKMNAGAVFLYPTSNGYSTYTMSIRDVRFDAADPNETLPDTTSGTPFPTACVASVSSGGYACRVTLYLPEPVDATHADRANAFLRLTSLYKGTDFRVSLSNNGTPVKFQAVQPIVDSTGRANDLFRRVESRVDLYDTSFPYPEAAVDVTGDFCKDFAVTDQHYVSGGCTP